MEATGQYNKNESGINWQDVQDCLVLVTQLLHPDVYENQTKKAITNNFIQQAMTDFFKHQLEPTLRAPGRRRQDLQAGAHQQALRENAEKTRLSIKKTNLQQITDMANRVQKFMDCRTKDATAANSTSWRAIRRYGRRQTARAMRVPGVMPIRGKILNCLKADYARIFKSDIIMDLIKRDGLRRGDQRQAHQGPGYL